MHFGGFQSSGMGTLTHHDIIRYSEQLGPNDDKPSWFEFDVYATEEQNSTRPHLDEKDFFNDGFNHMQRIGTLSIEYSILGDDYNDGEDLHCIDLIFRHDDGTSLEAQTWFVLPDFKHKPSDRNERTLSISRVKDAAAQLASQHPQCTVDWRKVDLYLKKTYHQR